jgi:hypothetical protein
MSDRNLALASTLPDSDRVSGTYARPTSATLEAKAASVRDLATQVAAGDMTPKRIAALLESLAQGLEVNAGEVLALESRSR